MKSLFRKVLATGFVVVFLVAIGSAFLKWNMVVYASGPIYIRADGSVEGTTFIVSSDNVTYVFTADINDCDIMYVQRSNIIVDGNGHVLNSSGTDADGGISVESVNNVTIQNVSIHNFPFGIYLYDAVNNTISGNNVTNNNVGISINQCGNNTVSGNNVTGSNQRGIYLYSSANNNIISGNKVEGSPNGIGVEWSMNNVISGNNITANNITSYTYDGIYLYSSSGNNISGNYIANNSRYGISLTYYCSNNTLNGNNITANNNGGIYLDGSSNNVISGNNIRDSPNEHIALLHSSNNNTVSGNNLANSTADVGVYVYGSSSNSFFGNNITNNADTGIRLDSSADSTISENNISENFNGVYLWYCSNITVSGNDITANDASGIILDSSGNNIVKGNNIISNNYWGINPAYSNNNTISGNNIRNNNVGVNFASSDFNIVSANNIIDNVYSGIYLESSSNNTFHHNNLINNTNQVLLDEPGYANNWDDGYPSGGNYWSEYADVDDNSGPSQNITGVSDGIWDHPYVIDENNTDYYPLTLPYDAQPPTITNVVQDPPSGILPDTVVRINATVTDAMSGVKQVLLNCTFTNSTDTWYSEFSMTHLVGDVWNATIPACPYGTNVTYVIIAEDNAGNTITTEQLYGYKYEYPVVPEFPLAIILVAFMTATTLLTAVVSRKKRHFQHETK
jgi:parallel beta-helix repeat protein